MDLVLDIMIYLRGKIMMVLLGSHFSVQWIVGKINTKCNLCLSVTFVTYRPTYSLKI